MNKEIAAAIFKSRDESERAIRELRDINVPDEAISILSIEDGHSERHDGSGKTVRHHDNNDNKASGALKGLAVGGGVGAIAGLAALAIPGIGPFIAAGALAETLGVAGSAAVASGAVGAAAGGLTGSLVRYGFGQRDAEEYERRIREGGILVAVDTSNLPSHYAPVRAVLRAAGGQSAEKEEALRG